MVPFILVKKRIEKRPHFTGKKCGHKMQRFLCWRCQQPRNG
ncbi:hypothetical protein SC1083_1790 [Aggregatibacter actinomycetemcomitans serotype e str. SC1083]|uniref:Uncharacterized protein n=1 Tax=Aggregatibacter actinomycetemcomitans serotype e str. SC1083 TaxID=907488 RepID=G4AAB7_AGGAC|nr:hypothetical protein SC1083_1790 [Aggregatibacter actinomycetemcomitans serotype e str. SC1083]